MVTHEDEDALAPQPFLDARPTDLGALVASGQRLIGLAFRSDLDLDVFLAEVLAEALQLVPYDIGWLLLREGDRVRVRAADAHHRADLGITLPLADCLSGLSMLAGRPVYIPDLSTMPEISRRLYKAPRSAQVPMGSELVVPLMMGDVAIGAFNMECRLMDGFEPRHLGLLQVLGGNAALAIELARSRQETAALSAVSLQLAAEIEMPALVRAVLDHALALIGAHFGQLLLREGPHDLVVHYTTNHPPRDLGLRVPVRECISGMAVTERRPVIVPDVTQGAYFVVDLPSDASPGAPGGVHTGPPAGVEGQATLVARSSGVSRYARVLEREKERIHAELAVPLFSGARVVGVLNVETPRENGFVPAQREALAALAATEGAAFARALGGSRREALQTLLTEALARADTAFGQLLQLDDDQLVIVQTTGGEPAGTRVPTVGSVSGRAVLTGAEVYVPDVDQEPLYRRYLGEEMKSELAVPLVSREQVIGVLNVESPVPGFFTVDHARILQTLAGQAAVAIERAQRTELERLAAIGGLAGDIIHRLNNPIGALSGWLDMLQRKPFYGEMVERYPYVGQFVARAGRDVERAKSIIQELRAEIRRQAPVPVVLQAAVAEALTRCGLDGEGGSIKVRLRLPDEPLRVLAGPGLTGVFWNLFDNALKAMPGGGSLSVTAQQEPGWSITEVADTGAGIAPWRLATLFDAGESTTTDGYAPAHGLGLWWTRGQVESFGGSISAKSEPGAGARFVVRLRLAG
jgi:signal transduction histidine kinase